ncbi:MAG: hypothetical protein QOF30_744 [Acidimicrobiaceae bacterium]|nr:hypothetical protein [Acidimicrobiaceae bacterium]
MSDPVRGTPSQKYEIFLQLIRQKVTMAEVAEAWNVDRTTVRGGTDPSQMVLNQVRPRPTDATRTR